jgi:hypothetical protein
MQTDHPTTTVYFVFSLTFCKLKVYKTEEVFVREILSRNKGVEPDDGDRGDENYTEIDTRVFGHLIKESLAAFASDVDAVVSATEKLSRSLKHAKQ